MKKSLSLFAIVAMLTACGGSGSGNGSMVADAGSNSDTAGSADGFTSSVVTMVGTAADNIEPAAIDSLTASSPDNTNPMSII